MAITEEEKTFSGATKIVGRTEEHSADVDSRKRLSVASDDSLVGNTGSQVSKTITSSPSLAAVGSSNLTNRKVLTVYAQTGIIYWGFSSNVNPTTGFPIYRGAPATVFDVSDGCSIWLVSSSTQTARVGESP